MFFSGPKLLWAISYISGRLSTGVHAHKLIEMLQVSFMLFQAEKLEEISAPQNSLFILFLEEEAIYLSY